MLSSLSADIPWAARLLLVVSCLTFTQRPRLSWALSVRSRHGRGRGGGRVSAEGYIPEPLKLKRKWCHPRPDYHDSLVSGCALMLPYIWASGSCNCLGSATGAHLGHFTSLNTNFHVFLPAWETGQGFDHAECKLRSLFLSKHISAPC